MENQGKFDFARKRKDLKSTARELGIETDRGRGGTEGSQPENPTSQVHPMMREVHQKASQREEWWDPFVPLEPTTEKLPLADKRCIIYPEMARRILEHKGPNRNLKRLVIQLIIDDLRNGNWTYNMDPIRFCWHGILRDGQNRLQACVESGIPLDTKVGVGFDPKTIFMVIDTNRSKRTLADLLKMEGMSNANTLASTIRLVRAYQIGQINLQGNTRPVSMDKAFNMLYDFPELTESVKFTLGCPKIIYPSVAAACHFLFHQAQGSPTMANRFFDSFKTGTNLQEGDPVLTLRRWLEKYHHQGVKKRMYSTFMMAMVIKAWNCFITGRSMKKLVIRKEDADFPRISAVDWWDEDETEPEQDPLTYAN